MFFFLIGTPLLVPLLLAPAAPGDEEEEASGCVL
jgi:hypothetical protein